MSDWTTDAYQTLTKITSTHDSSGKVVGFYLIEIARRPHYCDRGDWLIQITQEGHASGSWLDGADGFPRYFFGSEEEVKAQMDVWISRRKECSRERRPNSD